MRLVFLGIFSIIIQAHALTINEEYEKCKNEEGFGNKTMVCDVDKRLSERTVAKLTHLLDELKEKIPCQCEGGCERPDGREGYLGLLMVTDSNNTKSLAQESRKIYSDAGLSVDDCDYGLLMIYLKDTAQLATYRGGDSFVLLTDEDMQKLHELATKGTEGSDAVALQYLLQNYKDAVGPQIQRADSWMPVVGLIAALLIVLLILAVLMSLFLAKFCCCCYKNKKELYTVNTIPTYKTIEPLYVITPPNGSERYPHSDAIYSTPYSGSPLPYPPPPGASRPITPSSMYRTRVVPMGPPPMATPPMATPSPATQRRRERGEYGEKKSTASTPSATLQRRIERGEIADKRSVAGDSSTYAFPFGGEPLYAASTLPHGRDAYMPPISEAYGTIPRPWVSARDPRDGTLRQSVLTESDLSFLDPHRKQETQTREDFIGEP